MKLTDGGKHLDATFNVERHRGALTVTFDSRSGKRGTTSARNSDYERGLEVIFARLRDQRAVVSQVTLHPANGKEGSKLVVEGFPLPLRLAEVNDTSALRLALSRAQQSTDRRAGAKGGGNPTKRLRIYVDIPHMNEERLASILVAGGGASARALTGPTADPAELERKVAALRRQGAIGRPSGRIAPVRVAVASLGAYERDPVVKAWVLQEASGICEYCGKLGPFKTTLARPFWRFTTSSLWPRVAPTPLTTRRPFVQTATGRST